ncbi:MAG: hypothetical protein AMS17_04995, partial [Spirochaetes bacterium DG_61]
MCGIVGYIGKKIAAPILIDGLRRLEYRGYDSAGIAVLEETQLVIKKASGKVQQLASFVEESPPTGTIGIAHTRWATHGEPNEVNAHPHLDCSGDIAIVHNGIIENFDTLKKYLQGKGHVFRSDTDTEVIAHLIEDDYTGNLLETIALSLAKVEGTYGLAVLFKKEPQKLYAARKGSPLLIGKGKDELFIASDVAAILRYTNEIVYLEDGEIAELSIDGFHVRSEDNLRVSKEIQQVTWNLAMIEKGGYEHFMLKEIHEQKNSLLNAIRGRLNYEDGTARLDGLLRYIDHVKTAQRIIIT